jgi:hypothetical protein
MAGIKKNIKFLPGKEPVFSTGIHPRRDLESSRE